MLEKGYEAARNALQNELAQIEVDAEAYEESLANGGEWSGEVDDEGHILWDQSIIYKLKIEDTRLALREVRKAFVIALYHFWEDSVANWMALNGKQANHKEMEKYCSSEGYGPSPDLGAVRCLANHLKHGRNSTWDWLGQLRTGHPAFLPPQLSETLDLSEETLLKVAAAIFASGPTAPSGA